MATTVPDSALAPKVDQLSSPSSHAGSAAHPVTELPKEEPRVVGADLLGPYDANKEESGGVGGIEKGVSKLTVNSLTETGGFSNATPSHSTGEHLGGIEPQGARKPVDLSAPTPSNTPQKPAVDVAEEKLRTAANTAANYLPSQETQQQAFNKTSAALSSTASVAASGATYAGNFIASATHAAYNAVQPHLPETLGGPHNPAYDKTVNDDLDDLVTRAAEAKEPISASSKKAITATPDASTVGKEEERHFDVSNPHPEPALDTQQRSSKFTESLGSDKTQLREPKIPVSQTSPAGIIASTHLPTPSATAIAIDKSRSGTASAPPTSTDFLPISSTSDTLPVSHSKPVDTQSAPAAHSTPQTGTSVLPSLKSDNTPHPSRDTTARSSSPSSTKVNVDPAEKSEIGYHSMPHVDRHLESEKPDMKVIDHKHSTTAHSTATGLSGGAAKEEEHHKAGFKEKIVEKVKSVVHH